MGPQLGRGAAWLPTSYHGRLSDTRVAGALADEESCRAHSQRIAKTIRLNGHLDAVFNVSHALGWRPPVVLHLVRDPRAIYASRRRLSSPFGLPVPSKDAGGDGGQKAPSEAFAKHTAKQAKTLRGWARGLCGATQRDRAAGNEFGAAGYEFIDYSTLVRRPEQLVEGLYRRHFRRPVPPEVHAYIAKHLPPPRKKRSVGSVGGGSNGTSDGTTPQSWQFQYGTDARDVDAVEQRWKSELRPWERQAIDAGCGLSSST